MTTDRTEERQLGTCSRAIPDESHPRYGCEEHLQRETCCNWRPIAPEKPANEGVLTSAWKTVMALVDEAAPRRPHEGACTPESGCDASCQDLASIAEAMNIVRRAAFAAPAPTTDLEGLREEVERERGQIAEAVVAIKLELESRQWLTEGRGSYSYDDDKWHDEFGFAIDAIRKLLEPVERIGANFSNRKGYR